MDEPTTDGGAELPLMRWSVETIQGPAEVEGYLLGRSTSENPRHSHPGPSPSPGRRCSACRWTQVAILRSLDGTGYVVVNEGMTRVPGEQQRGKVERTTSPIWVIECLKRPGREDEGARYIPAVSRKALAEAAANDPALAEQFTTRVS